MSIVYISSFFCEINGEDKQMVLPKKVVEDTIAKHFDYGYDDLNEIRIISRRTGKCEAFDRGPIWSDCDVFLPVNKDKLDGWILIVKKV